MSYTVNAVPNRTASQTWAKGVVEDAVAHVDAEKRGKTDLAVYADGWDLSRVNELYPEAEASVVVGSYFSPEVGMKYKLFVRLDGSLASASAEIFDTEALANAAQSFTCEGSLDYPDLAGVAVWKSAVPTGDTIAKVSQIPSIPVTSVNGKSGGAVTLNAADVGAATPEDATLVNASDWVCSPAKIGGGPVYIVQDQSGAWYPSDGEGSTGAVKGDAQSLSLSWAADDWYGGVALTATRAALGGYRLGPDDAANPNRNKFLASEAEAETLRTLVAGKQDALTQEQLDNLSALGDFREKTDMASYVEDGIYWTISGLTDPNLAYYNGEYHWDATEGKWGKLVTSDFKSWISKTATGYSLSHFSPQEATPVATWEGFSATDVPATSSGHSGVCSVTATSIDELATKLAVTLVERGFSEWTILRDGVDVTSQVPTPPTFQELGSVWLVQNSHIAGDSELQDMITGKTSAALSLSWSVQGPDSQVTYTATRTKAGYQLGSQTEKPLASEDEVEDLRILVAGKQDQMTIEVSPIENSQDPISSGGVWTALQGKQDTLTFDSTPTSGSQNPVTSEGIKSAIDNAKHTMIYNVAGTDALDDKGGLHLSTLQQSIWTAKASGSADIVYDYVGYLQNQENVNVDGMTSNTYVHVWNKHNQAISVYDRIFYNPETGKIYSIYLNSSYSRKWELLATQATNVDPRLQSGILNDVTNALVAGSTVNLVFTPTHIDINSNSYAHFALEDLPNREYSTSSAYAVGDLVKKDGVGYRCNTAIASGEAWNANHWTKIPLVDDKASTADATLNKRGPNKDGFGAWTIKRDGTDVTEQVRQPEYLGEPSEGQGLYLWRVYVIEGDEGQTHVSSTTDWWDAVSLSWSSSGGMYTATRTALPGYQLGSQEDKPLASEADATLAERGPNKDGFSEWTILRDGVDVTSQVPTPPTFQELGSIWFVQDSHISGDSALQDLITGWTSAALSLSWVVQGPDSQVTYTATRTALSGYRLGPDNEANPNRDKLLASEAEAEALRTGKLGNSGAQTLNGPLTAESFKSAPGNGAYVILEIDEYGNAYIIVEPTGGAGESKIRIPYAYYASGETFALLSNIPYSLGTPTVIDTASSETVEGETVYYGAATLADRTANIVQVTAATPLAELRITFPSATSGKVRDFGLRVEVGTGSAALAAPALVPIAPSGETITMMNAAGEMPTLADGTTTASGVTLLYFRENAPGVFVVKGEQVKAIPQSNI